MLHLHNINAEEYSVYLTILECCVERIRNILSNCTYDTPISKKNIPTNCLQNII